MAIISPDLQNEIIALAELLAVRFSQPEFIPGCEVIDVTDLSEYATNNGWIEAVCGQHNQQRVRWKSGETVAVSDFIDVLYFADRRLFEAWGLGGSTSIPATGGWPFANVLTVSTTDAQADYSTVTAAIAAASAGDSILLDAETYTIASNLTIGVSLTIEGDGPEATVLDFSVSGGAAFEATANSTTIVFRNLTITTAVWGQRGTFYNARIEAIARKYGCEVRNEAANR